ncbi:hypothetical protein like AT2G15220 [Hibiscus trionum]|uniref:Plant basic secretory protein (BSP) family protein n=1 Tax=Hibiscus trionum TaxID=183268 RepID=A0A9W7M115_HIBTR|nr:hypothetical protein like AT2G15220 [Hibiscus trionum]
MANTLFSFSLLTLSLAAMHGTHAEAVEYVINYSSGNSSGGVRFKKEIGVANTLKTMSSATNFIWDIFQQNNPSNRKNVTKVTLFIENSDGVAFTVNNEIHVNANYLGNYTGDLRREFNGVVYHEMTHVWQWDGKGQTPGGLIEGVADFVRLKANYIPSHWVQPGQGNRWDQGYDVTARFLDYCDGLRHGFVAELNKKMRNSYNAGYFVKLLGKTVDQLWSDYKAKYGN